jgi:hypothetical protein
MKKINLFVLVFALCFSSFTLHAGERTIPVDIFLMIDKSLSMAEPGKFDSLREWVQDQLIGQVLIDGDWITIYQFYGKSSNLLTLDVRTGADRKKIVKTITGIKPNGQYTDIGLALDTIKDALKARGPNGRHKILLLLTDLKQEAPWSSRYAGKQDNYQSPYLAEARQIKHDNWYEITLDMDIQDSVVKTSHELFTSIQDQLSAGTPRELPAGNGEKLAGDGSGSGTAGEAGAAGAGAAGKPKNGITVPGIGTLPLLPILVLLSGILVVCLILVPILIVRRRNREKEEQTT